MFVTASLSYCPQTNHCLNLVIFCNISPLISYFVSLFLFLQAELSQALTSLTEKARNAKDFMVQLKHTVEHVQVSISVVIISCMFICTWYIYVFNINTVLVCNV